MTLDLNREERDRARTEPTPFPPHGGQARFEAALAQDRVYRGALLAAVAMAGAAGTGFGSIFGLGDRVVAAALAVGAAGVVVVLAGATIAWPLIRRARFWQAALAVGLLHLACVLVAPRAVEAALVAQLAAASAEFALLAVAGVRWFRAGLLRLPPATYLRSPQCVVARLDRGKDFTLRIDAVE